MQTTLFYGPGGDVAHFWPTLWADADGRVYRDITADLCDLDFVPSHQPKPQARRSEFRHPLSAQERAAKLAPGAAPWQRTLYWMMRNDLPNDDAEHWLAANDASYVDAKAAWRGFLPVKERPYSRRRAGRPTVGLVDELAQRALERALPHHTHDDLSECCRSRRRTGRLAAVHDELAIAVATTRINHAWLAGWLGCNRRTIERLHAKGVALTTQDRIAVALERQAEATERLVDVTVRLFRERESAPAQSTTPYPPLRVIQGGKAA